MAATTPSTSNVSEYDFQTTPRRSPRKRSQPNSSEDGTKAKRTSLSFKAETQEQRNFTIKPLRELTAKLYPYVKDEHIYLLTHLLELDRQSIEQSNCPLLDFMEAAEETGRISSSNVDCLFNAFEILQPCEEVTQALNEIKAYKEKIAPVESENDSDLTSPTDPSKSKTAESHWQKFKEWCYAKGISDLRNLSGKNVTDYLERMYPNKKVVTIRKHYASMKKRHKFSPNEDKHISKFLNELAITEMQQIEGQ